MITDMTRSLPHGRNMREERKDWYLTKAVAKRRFRVCVLPEYVRVEPGTVAKKSG